ncbi:uncharacterized protein JCM10292_006832 [Rhodotorula paludigena]|uniref:uncharacterized protein n=1 Tax=Rhodotorula paludigena TaxID=86838 RepID=UPI00317DA663
MFAATRAGRGGRVGRKEGSSGELEESEDRLYWLNSQPHFSDPHEMAPLRRPLAALRDDLDSLLEDYLSALDDYQRARTTLQQHLKDGYFDLARAKVALGPTRVGPASYDLAERASQRIVSIAPVAANGVASAVFVSVDAEGTSAEGKSALHDSAEGDDPSASTSTLRFALELRPAPPPPPVAGDTEAVGANAEHGVDGRGSSLRQRRPPSRSSSPSRADQAPSASSPQRAPSPPAAATASPAVPSPLAQFSPFPPAPLRSSAASFVRAAEACVALVGLERRVRECARRVKRGRREVALAERERGGEEAG